jgi:hypothetical protein
MDYYLNNNSYIFTPERKILIETLMANNLMLAEKIKQMQEELEFKHVFFYIYEEEFRKINIRGPQ